MRQDRTKEDMIRTDRQPSSKTIRLLEANVTHSRNTIAPKTMRLPEANVIWSRDIITHPRTLCNASPDSAQISLSFGTCLRKHVKEALLADRFNNDLRYKMVYYNYRVLRP